MKKRFPVLRQKPTQILPQHLLKEASIQFFTIYLKNHIFQTSVLHENFFKLIFETRIQIQIQIRSLKSLLITIYYLTTIHLKYLYLHSKTYNMGLKLNLYLTPLPHRGPVNPPTSTFGNINFTETMTNLIMATWKFNQKRLKGSLFAP